MRGSCLINKRLFNNQPLKHSKIHRIMNRIAIAILMAVTLTAAAAAQNYIVENPQNKAYFGVRAGADISSTAGAPDEFGNGAGFTIGGIYNLPVWKNMFFEPGIYAYYDTFDNDIATWTPADPPQEGVHKEYDGSIRNWGIRVPLNFGYRFDFTDNISISVFTGPVLNLNLSAKAHCDGLTDYTYSLMDTKDFKRFDAQWNFGVGMSYGHNCYVSISGAVGMTKAYEPKGDDISFRRNTVNIAVGYNF